MQTIRIFEEVQEDATKKDLRQAILEDFPYDTFKIESAENGLSVTNPIEGKLFFPDRIIQYYHKLYTDGIEHKTNFVRYNEVIDKAIVAETFEEKIQVVKDVSRWFAFVQMHAENYSIAAYLMHREDIEREDMITMYTGFAREDMTLIPENLHADFMKALHNVLYYFKFLIGVFTVLD